VHRPWRKRYFTVGMPAPMVKAYTNALGDDSGNLKGGAVFAAERSRELCDGHQMQR